jgi:hypothetical protein
VFKPSEYIDTTKAAFNWSNIDRFCIVTELFEPYSGVSITDATHMYKRIFKKGIVYAYEMAHKVVKASPLEKEFYNKKL